MTDQQPEPQAQGPVFTSGFDFLNHHLNMAMRFTERVAPKQWTENHPGPKLSHQLAELHTELARVGALASIAQYLQQLGAEHTGAIAGLTGAVERLVAHLADLDMVEEPWDPRDVEEPLDDVQPVPDSKER